MQMSLRLLLTAVAAASMLVPPPGSLLAQQVEIGGWIAANASSEVTTDITICAGWTCGPAATMPSRWRRAPAGAVVSRLHLHPRLALRAEAALVPKGYTPPTHPYVTSTYIELPLAAELAWLRLAGVELTALAGLVPARLLDCTVSAETVHGFVRTGCQEAWYDGRIVGPRNQDLGVLIGGGVRRRTGAGTTFAEIRYVRGVMDSHPQDDGRTLNRTLTLAAGHAFTVPAR